MNVSYHIVYLYIYIDIFTYARKRCSSFVCGMDPTYQYQGMSQVHGISVLYGQKNIEIMHVGIVCQLNYHGGGLLQYQVGDEWSQIAFTQSPFLQVGQRVSFIQRFVRRTAEAVDIQPLASHEGLDGQKGEMRHAENLEQSKVSLPSEDMRRKDTSTVSTVDRPLSQTRRLQRSIGVFQNADSQERLDMVRRAEDLLQQLLEEPEIDGDGICKLVRRCVGWLHVPIPFDRPTVAKNQDSNTDEVNPEEHPSELSNLQGRVRRLLILALNSLDLTDAVTFQAVEEALNYIRILLQQAERSHYGHASALKQWARLEALVTPTYFGKAEKHRELRMAHKDKGTVFDGSYTPNRKVRDLPMVFQSDEIIKLECSKCSHVIRSNWFWRHTGTGRLHVVVPMHGHSDCTTKLGKKCPWIVRGEMPQRNDNFIELDLCPHHRTRAKCRDCGGRQICVHNRRRYRCKLCKTSRRTQRVERDGDFDFAAPVCQRNTKIAFQFICFVKIPIWLH